MPQLNWQYPILKMKKNNLKYKFIPDSFFKKILQVLPIVCVDLLVINEKNKILLIKRKNEPAKGEWWFPGGRVYKGEQRTDAAKRKLFEECGLVCASMEEIKTLDCILFKKNILSHGVTTIYKLKVCGDKVKIDSHSDAYAWKTKHAWRKMLAGTVFLNYFTQATL
jgi:colanic acid biosynthesis protein WcaH